MDIKQLSSFRYKIETELFDSVIPFWEKHSLDSKNGGYFNCLDRKGEIYDTRKHVWLQGRQVWMFSKLYNTVEAKPEWLEIARLGAEFLLDYTKRNDDRVFFCVTDQGKGIWMQRKIFSECFWIMALAEYSRASGEKKYMQEALQLFDKVWEWSSDFTKVGRPVYEGAKAMNNLSVPMIMLNLIEEISGGDFAKYKDRIISCINRMKLHVHNDREIIFENISPEGSFIDDIDGRMLNPGHAIEAGWFLQHWALHLNDKDLSKTAVNMVRWSFERGWDDKFGGLFYFLDSEGHSPVQLEWDMKLWWPHTEAMYAHLLNFSVTGNEKDFEDFKLVTNYSFEHFSDPEYGEWFGYLNRRGERTHDFKGGPYKGCFHVPRTLLLCRNLLMDLEKRHNK